MPHQGIVLVTASIISLAITLGFVLGTFLREKKQQSSNTDEH